jgi:uncharacterized protein (TIGR02265 family)
VEQEQPIASHHRASLSACFAATDLEWRLRQIPDTAMCRGAYFNMLDARAGVLGSATQHEYRRFFRIHRYTPFRMYPVSDYLTRLVVLAQIEWGAPGIYRGLRIIQSSAFETWSATIVGRAAVRLFEPTLAGMLRGIERAFASRMVVDYASFSVEEVRPERIVTRFTNEYNYIEHAMVGALEGVARLCGVQVEAEVDLDGPFDGRVILHVARGGVRRSAS